MNWDQLAGKWKQSKGKIKEQWGRLSDNDLRVVAGKRDQFIGLLQERYGIVKEEAVKQVDEFVQTLEAATKRKLD